MNIDRANWMSKLPGSTRLFDVLMPGTHDTMAWSATGKFAPILSNVWKTQTSTIKDQLNSGIRSFDLRPRDFGNNTYPMHHDRIELGYPSSTRKLQPSRGFQLIDDALRPIEEFLKKNEGETVIISIKPEHTPEYHDSNFTVDLLEKRLTGDQYFTTPAHFKQAEIDNPQYKGLLTTQNPKVTNTQLDYNLPLELLRGKILVILRDGIFAKPEATKASYRNPNTAFTGFDAMTPTGDKEWGEYQSYRRVQSDWSNDILVQDMHEKWASTKFETKLRVMENFWDTAIEEKDNEKWLWFNAANSNYSKGRPKEVADVVNPEIIRILDPNDEAFKTRSFVRGIVSMDYVKDHQNTVDAIIDFNNHLKPLTSGDDFKFGSASGDIFKGLEGNDKIYASGGDDILISDSEGDQLHGGKDNDKFIGLANRKHKKSKFNPLTATKMFGATGNDIFTVSEGMYDIDGGAGIDTLRVVLSGNYQLKKQTSGYFLSTESGSLKVQLSGIEQLEVFDATTTSPEPIGLLDANEDTLIEARLDTKTLATEPTGSNLGNFKRRQSLSLISPDQYGLQPQLKWYDGNACYPTAVANAFAGLASYYSIPELLKQGSTKQNQLLNTLQAVGEAVQTTKKGTHPKNMVPGLKNYFKQQDLENDFEAVNIFGDQKMKPIENKQYLPTSTPADNYKLTSELITAFAKGAVVFSNAWIQPDGSWKAGHVVTGVSLEFDDKNRNMIVDRGEAYLTMIDPLNPASNYTPPSIDIAKIDSDKQYDEIFNNTVQAAENATANLQKVEIFQNAYGLSFLQKVSSVDYTVNKKDQKLDVNIDSESEFRQGQFFSATSLRKTSYQGDLDKKIDISDEIESQDGEIIFSFDDYLQDNKVSAEIFSYFNEESQLSNNLGFYQVLDLQGTIQDPISGQQLKPGDFGYRDKAWELSKSLSTSASNADQNTLAKRESEDHSQMGSFSFQLTAQNNKALLAPIVQTSQGNLFTSFADANADGFNHFVSRGDMAFGFEDLFGLGDKDFNDLQVMMTPLTINGLS